MVLPRTPVTAEVGLAIAAYGFLIAERTTRSAGRSKKNAVLRNIAPLPADYIPRGSPARAATRGRLARHPAPRAERAPARKNASMSVLPQTRSVKTVVTQ